MGSLRIKVGGLQGEVTAAEKQGSFGVVQQFHFSSRPARRLTKQAGKRGGKGGQTWMEHHKRYTQKIRRQWLVPAATASSVMKLIRERPRRGEGEGRPSGGKRGEEP